MTHMAHPRVTHGGRRWISATWCLTRPCTSRRIRPSGLRAVNLWIVVQLQQTTRTGISGRNANSKAGDDPQHHHVPHDSTRIDDKDGGRVTSLSWVLSCAITQPGGVFLILKPVNSRYHWLNHCSPRQFSSQHNSITHDNKARQRLSRCKLQLT